MLRQDLAIPTPNNARGQITFYRTGEVRRWGLKPDNLVTRHVLRHQGPSVGGDWAAGTRRGSRNGRKAMVGRCFWFRLRFRFPLRLCWSSFCCLGGFRYSIGKRVRVGRVSELI